MESGLRCMPSTCQYMQDQWEGLKGEMSTEKISFLCLWSVSLIENYFFEGKMCFSCISSSRFSDFSLRFTSMETGCGRTPHDVRELGAQGFKCIASGFEISIS